MKPNWDEAPEWAKWLAMDVSGVWWWSEREPVLGTWESEGYWNVIGKVECAQKSPLPDYETTKES